MSLPVCLPPAPHHPSMPVPLLSNSSPLLPPPPSSSLPLPLRPPPPSQATVQHLRDRLQTSRLNEELLAAAGAREEELSQQMRRLAGELVEAKKYQTPVG